MSSSSSSQEIKYVSVARVNDATLLLALPSSQTKKAYADEYRKEAQDISNTLRDSTVYPDLRDSTDSIYGVWFTQVDRNMVAYSVLTDTDFKSTLAYQFLKDVAKEIYQEVPSLSHDLESMPNLNRCKDAVAILMSQGAKPANDKLSKAHDVVTQATKVMQDNDMDEKAASIKDTAFNIKNNARALEMEARKRNCRMWAIIICLIVSLLIYIIVPLATTLQ